MLPCLINPAAEVLPRVWAEAVVHTGCGRRSGSSPRDRDSAPLARGGSPRRKRLRLSKSLAGQCFPYRPGSDHLRGTWPYLAAATL